MNIKIQCDCGSRYSFEVEPVNGVMPVAINCPNCNRQATEAANAEIALQLAASAKPTARIRVISKAAEAAAPSQAEAPAAVGAPAMCSRHLTETVVETCRVCGKPICLKCMQQFGYVCSHYCGQQAEARKLDIPVYENQASYKLEKSKIVVKRLVIASIAAVALALGLWFWYAWFGRDPTAVYTVNTPIPETAKYYVPKEFYRLIGPGQVLRISTNKLTLLDVVAKNELWSVDLPKGSRKTAAGDSDGLEYDTDSYYGSPEIAVSRSDIWMWSGGHLLQVDRKAGGIKTPVNGRILSVRPSATALLAVTRNAAGKTLLTRISMPEGGLESEEIVPTASTNAPIASAAALNAAFAKLAGAKSGKQQGAAGAAAAATASTNPVPASFLDYYFDDRQYVPAGPNVAHFQADLLEVKYTERQAMKPKGKSVVNDSNLSAGQGMEVAEEVFNDMQRQATGGVEREDASRYKVTVHRHFAKDVADWSGEMEGMPHFFSLKTVDVIGAGHKFVVVDKNNKKLWEAKLTYNVHPVSEFRYGVQPCLETKDSLFFADEGMLARYDLATGDVRWRLNSVWISRIQEDGHGSLYVNTTTAGPEDIRYSQQANFKKQINPVIIKVDVGTGKQLWRRPVFANECILTGKYVYSSYDTKAYELLNLEDGPKGRYNLNLIAPSSGQPIWNYHQDNRQLMRAEAIENWTLVQFEDKLVVMKFFSL